MICFKRKQKGLSLTELLAAMVISMLVLTTAIAVYSQTRRSAVRLNEKIDRDRLPMELLQKIAEDIDKTTGPIASQQEDISISIKNKLDNLHQSAQMIITRQFYNKKNQKEIYDEIVWQTNYDLDANSLVLYRSHRGLTVEDKLFDEKKDDWKKELFIPVSDGLTYFKIEAFKGDDFIESWTESSLPNAIRVTLSFDTPYRGIDGKYEVDDYYKQVRTIAVNRGRNYKFAFVPPDYNNLFYDSNEPADFNDVNDPNSFNSQNSNLGNKTDSDPLQDFINQVNEQK